MSKLGTAGNRGDAVRSDCFVTFELAASGGTQIDLHSRVKPLYGGAIQSLAKDMLAFFNIENCHLTIEDAGALDFVIAARIEAAITQVVNTDRQFLPDMLPENEYHTEKDRFRRSRLYLPGNTPKLMLNAGVHQPDGIILDLEDSVAPPKKDEARLLVRNALRQVNFYGAERMVRINQLPHSASSGQARGLTDLEFVIPHNANLILIPKVESAAQVQAVDAKIAEIAAAHGIEHPVWLMPIIESALGVVNAYPIAAASPNVVALAIGLEDYTADIGAARTPEGRESFFARSQLVNAARAAGVQPIDSVFSDVSDMDALRRVVGESKALGFDGMGCIHPRQIAPIHQAFAPTPAELEKAQKIVAAFEKATAKGLGVVSLGSKMIDPPVVKRAQRVVALAERSGLLDTN